MKLLLLILLMGSVCRASIVCDNPTGPNCNVDTSITFNGAGVTTVDYGGSPGSTIVSGVTYEYVIQLLPSDPIDSSWIMIEARRNHDFDCSACRMWYNGIIVDAADTFVGNLEACVFNMQTGILSTAYMAAPGNTVFFLLDGVNAGNRDIDFEKDTSIPIIPSDGYNPINYDPEMICATPGTNCNPVVFGFTGVTSTQLEYPAPANTDVVGGVGTFDLVKQLVFEDPLTFDFTIELYPRRRGDPFDCSGSRLWLNGTIAYPISGFRGSDPYCYFDINNGLLPQAYLDDPFRTIFILFDSPFNVGNDYFITRNTDNPVVSQEAFNPVGTTAYVCLDRFGPFCNVVAETYVDAARYNYNPTVDTIETNGGQYKSVVQWNPDVVAVIDFTWEINPQANTDPIDCSQMAMWINGTVVGFDSLLRGGNLDRPYCRSKTHEGVLPQSIIDHGTPGIIFFLFNDFVVPGLNYDYAENYEKTVYSVENWDPSFSTEYICDFPNSVNCNVQDTQIFVMDGETQVDYLVTGPTIVGGVTYEQVIKWIPDVPLESPLAKTWQIYPNQNADVFDCTLTNMWIDGKLIQPVPFPGDFNNGNAACYFDINFGILTNAEIADMTEAIYVLFETGAINAARYKMNRYDGFPIYSVENYDPTTNPKYVCDDPDGPSCNPNVFIDWSPMVPGTPLNINYEGLGPTTVGGVVYDNVIRIDPTETLTYSLEFSPQTNSETSFTCGNSKMWFNGTVVSAYARFRGSQNQDPYCVFDISDGVLTQAYIQNPTAVYVLLDSIIDPGLAVDFAENYDNPVVAAENMVFYLYEIIQLTESTDPQAGTTYTFTIDEITYESPFFGGVGQCNDIRTSMSFLQFGQCSIPFETEDTINDIYSFLLPPSFYEFCADSVANSGNNLVFTFTLTLPGTVNSCNYFGPGDSTRTSIVEVASGGGGGPGGSLDIVIDAEDFDARLCSLEDYIIPRARSEFTINVTFGGDAIEFIKMPYLDTVDNPLITESKTCTFRVNQTNYCIYEFVSTLCKPLDQLSAGGCAFDRFSGQILKDLDIRQTVSNSSQLAVVDVIPEFDSGLEYVTFGDEICNPGLSNNMVNVSDTLVKSTKLRNSPFPDWGSEPSALKLYEDFIVQVEVTGSSGGDVSELHISSVDVRLYNAETGVIINRYLFNKADKELLHVSTYTKYYDDVHFCTYKYQNDTCERYYEQGTDRVNPFTELEILPQLINLCQYNYNQTLNDHFIFSPRNWFIGIDVPRVKMEMIVTSRLVICDTGGGRRLGEDLGTPPIHFVTHSITMDAITPVHGSNISVTIVESDSLSCGDPSDHSDIIFIMILAGCLIFVSFLLCVTLINKRPITSTYSGII